jgi:L,D-transpeptidase ErfK/SrfK
MGKFTGKIYFFILLLFSVNTIAATYSIPEPSQSLIGSMQYTYSQSGDTVVTIAQRYDIGFNAIANANPELNLSRGFAAGITLQIPTAYLLPSLPRRGIIINLPEMRMYYFLPGSDEVSTYPIGIGKVGKTIPITQTAIVRKTKDPVWIPPPDIREFNRHQGVILPSVMPAGPDNPLGPYAIYLQVPTYLIHSTIFPESVGKRASFGCIRMYESDIEDFFPSVEKGIPVAIINKPIKIGWGSNKLYMEAHHPLEEHSDAYDVSLPGIVHTIVNTTKNRLTLIDWQQVSYIAKERDGIPHEIGVSVAQ